MSNVTPGSSSYSVFSSTQSRSLISRDFHVFNQERQLSSGESVERPLGCLLSCHADGTWSHAAADDIKHLLHQHMPAHFVPCQGLEIGLNFGWLLLLITIGNLDQAAHGQDCQCR